MRFLYSIAIVLLLWLPGLAQEKKVVLATLYWPPYTGANLPGEGESSLIVRQAFKAVGYDLEIRYYPWSRLLYEVQHDEDIDGYYPEYIGRESHFLYSNSIGKSPLGFAKRTSRDITWYSYDDLKQYIIGIVSGYVNTPRFDAMVSAGEIRVDLAGTDLFNLRKVLAGRVDLAVVDQNIYDYFVNADALLHSHREDLEMIPHLMDINDLYVCFPKSEAGTELMTLLNKGLQQLDLNRIRETYMDRIKKQVRQSAPGGAFH